LRCRDEIEEDFFGLSGTKDKRGVNFLFLETLLDIRGLLFEMNYMDDEGMCHCPECLAEREQEDLKEQEEIVIEELDEETINKLYEKENGKE
jgi:hypothetical protein